VPAVIRIGGLRVDDSVPNGGPCDLAFFGSPLGAPRADWPFPLQLTERLGVKNLMTASGQVPRVGERAELAKAITAVSLP